MQRNNQSTQNEIIANFNMSMLSTAETSIQSALTTVEQWYRNVQKYKNIEFLFDKSLQSSRNWYDTQIKFVLETVLSQIKK